MSNTSDEKSKIRKMAIGVTLETVEEALRELGIEPEDTFTISVSPHDEDCHLERFQCLSVTEDELNALSGGEICLRDLLAAYGIPVPDTDQTR